MKYNIGDRVGAIQYSNKEVVNFYGYGTYEGEQPCPKFFDLPNPKIKLDNGKIVWGMECWWGPEEEVKQLIGNRQIIIVEAD